MLLGHNFREFNILLDFNLFSQAMVNYNEQLIKKFMKELEVYQKIINKA